MNFFFPASCFLINSLFFPSYFHMWTARWVEKNNLSSSQVCEWLLRYIDAEGVKVMDFSLDPHHHHHRRTPSHNLGLNPTLD